MHRASLALLLCILTLIPAVGGAGTCPNCASEPMPNYTGPAFKLDIREDGGSFSVYCTGTTSTSEYLHVTPGAFVAWTLDPKSTAPFAVVTFGLSPFDDDVAVFVVYRGQWTWARVRDTIKPDPEAPCGGANPDVYVYTVSGASGGSPRSGPGVVVCPPENPGCH